MTGARIAALACALGALACTSASNMNPPPPPTGMGTGNHPVFGDSGMPPPPSGNVVIEILNPMSDLIAPAGSLIDVSAIVRVDQGTDYIDPISVEAAVFVQGEMTEIERSKLAAQGADAFSGRVSIGDQPTGFYTLKITGTSSGGMKGEGSVDFQIDGGPLLAVTSPQPLHPYKGLLIVEVLADGAQFGPLDGPHATIANFPIDLQPVGDPNDPNDPQRHTYRGTFNLRDPMPPMILPPLVDEQLLTVWATNTNGKRNEIHVVFLIDEEGPSITLTSPRPGEIVGDIMRIAATVADPSGVLDSSVIAVIGDDTTPAKFNVLLKPDGLGVYSTFFDTRKLTGCNDPPKGSDLCIVYPTISFRASDELSNERAIGYNFTVDNIAPVADLDPPKLRSFKIDPFVYCSWEFDPLGRNSWLGDMPNDGNRVGQVFDLRARIEDDGNHAVGLKLTPISGVDPNKTAMYVLDDETKALIVDTDGDGWCDSINPLLVPTTEPPVSNDQVLKIRLAPVKPNGNADFTPDPSLPMSPGPDDIALCARGPEPLPKLICTGHQPTVAIGYAGDTPAIWTLEHIDLNWCFGQPFDTYANNISEGWACIAAATVDNANNFSVSPPLRVDIEYKYAGAWGQAGRGSPPACTGTYDRVTNTVTNAPCKTRRFERQPNLADYFCFLTECPGPFLPL